MISRRLTVIGLLIYKSNAQAVMEYVLLLMTAGDLIVDGVKHTGVDKTAKNVWIKPKKLTVMAVLKQFWRSLKTAVCKIAKIIPIRLLTCVNHLLNLRFTYCEKQRD